MTMHPRSHSPEPTILITLALTIAMIAVVVELVGRV